MNRRTKEEQSSKLAWAMPYKEEEAEGNRRTKEEQSNAGFGSALQRGGPKVKRIDISFDEMLANTSPAIQQEVDMEFAVSNRIYELMTQRGLTKLQFAQALGKKPSEVTKWLSGQHNFSLRTISMLSAFFGQPLIQIQKNV